MNGSADTTPDAAWIAALRERFVEIARRRVPEDAAEDVAQDALRIVVDRGMAVARQQGRDRPPLKWCFMTLRNVIGNWYQKRRDHDDVDDVALVDERPTVLDALTTEERHRRIRATLERLRSRSEDCARWLWQIALGTKPAALAREADVEASAFHRRLYRCRRHLRALLEEEGLQP